VAGEVGVAQDRNGNVYAAWTSSLADHVMISYRTSRGKCWGAPVPIGLTAAADALAAAGDGEFETASLANGTEYVVPVSYSAQ
jgi:hypothetical protein